MPDFPLTLLLGLAARIDLPENRQVRVNLHRHTQARGRTPTTEVRHIKQKNTRQRLSHSSRICRRRHRTRPDEMARMLRMQPANSQIRPRHICTCSGLETI